MILKIKNLVISLGSQLCVPAPDLFGLALMLLNSTLFKMKKILYACALLAAFCNLQANGQNDNSVTNNAVAGLKSLSGNHIIEKSIFTF